jgi:putative toxin-antitoxin system antitoxin component (TIGR02293 family)
MEKTLSGRRPKNPGAGAVRHCVGGPAGKTRGPAFTPARLIAALRAGLPYAELEELQARLQTPLDQLLPRLDISKATLHRRKAAGRLEPAESDRVLRFARLLGRAVTVMESEDQARRWLNAPQTGLGGAVPLDYADSEVGAREVEDLLGRIEYGVYS